MSDEERKNAPDSDAPLTGDVRDGALVRQEHGGAIRNRPPLRLTNPTVADVAANAAQYLYRELPRLRRIAHNEASRPKTKRGRASKRSKGKALHSIEAQIRAFSELRQIATMDRTIRESRLAAFLVAIQDEILEFLPRDQADALLKKIATHVMEL